MQCNTISSADTRNDTETGLSEVSRENSRETLIILFVSMDLHLMGVEQCGADEKFLALLNRRVYGSAQLHIRKECNCS